MYTNAYDASLNVKNGFPVFSTLIEANSIGKHEDQFAAFKLTDEDRQEIHRLARDPRIGDYLARCHECTLAWLCDFGHFLLSRKCLLGACKRCCARHLLPVILLLLEGKKAIPGLSLVKQGRFSCRLMYG